MIAYLTDTMKTVNAQIQEGPVNPKQDNYKKYTSTHGK